MNQTLEQKRKRIETVVKLVGLCVVGFLVAPFIFATIKGLVGLVVAATVALVVINLMPSVAALIANWRLKALKAVAAANPIETLENQYAEREQALVGIRDNIKEFHTVVQELYSQIQEHNERFPNKPSQFLEKYEKMKALLSLRSQKYKKAQQNLASFAQLIDEKRSDWRIAQAAAKASKLANVGEDFQSKLMADTALTTIQDGLNFAFSELEVSLLDEQSEAQASTTTVVVDPTVPLVTKATLAAIAEKSGPPTLDLDFTEVVEAEPVLVRRGRK